MNALRVSTRLLVLSGGLIALAIGLGMLGLYGMSRSNGQLRTVYEDRTVPAVNLGAIDQLGLRSRLEIEQLLVGATDDRPRALERVAAHQRAADELWARYLATELTNEEKRLVERATAARARFVTEVLVPLRSAEGERLRRLVRDVVPGASDELDRVFDELMDLQAREAKAAFQQATGEYAQVRLAVFAALGIGVAAAVLLSLLIVRGLRAELGAEPAEAAAVARRVAAGDLGTPIVLRAGTGGDSLMAQLARMQDSLAGLVGQVRQTADGLATASTQIAQGNADLSGRTEAQASALQETAASMEQLQSGVRQNADSARLADERAREAAAVARRGGEAVEQVVLTMRDIHGQSQRIADIIGTIDGIAFQTNLLALNAAVEAARAGEDGRGFAVVAAEVRSVARRSAEAAREIKSLIGSSVERVQAGSALVEDAGRTIGQVVEAVGRVSDLVGAISAATSQQASGVAQVNGAVSQMDQTTQRNAALVEESAAAAETLRDQPVALVQAVQVFTVRGAMPRET